MHSHDPIALKKYLLEKYGQDLTARINALKEYLDNIDMLDWEDDDTLSQAFFMNFRSCLETLSSKNSAFHPLNPIAPEADLLDVISQFDKKHPFILDIIKKDPEKYSSPIKSTVTHSETPEIKSPDLGIENLLHKDRKRLKRYLEKIEQSPYPDLLQPYKIIFTAVLSKDWQTVDPKTMSKAALDKKIDNLKEDLQNQESATEKARQAFIAKHKELRTGFALFKKTDVDYNASLPQILAHANQKNNPSYNVCKELKWLDSKGNVLPAEKIASKFGLEGSLQLRTIAMRRGSESK